MSETLFTPTNNDDDNIVTTMGGLGGLLGQLFPGNQQQPQAVPGLTDLTFTRSFGGPGENFISSLFQDSTQGTRFWSPTGMGATSPFSGQQPEPEPAPAALTYDPFQEAALAALLSQDWSGVEQDLLRRIEAGRDLTNINVSPTISSTVSPTISSTVSPTISPTMTNIQSQTQQQEQAQSMGPGDTRQQQDQDQEDSDVSPDTSFDLDSYIRDILEGGTKGALADFFR
jgi:hypothetical protein